MNDKFLVPLKEAKAEITEKKSLFIGRIKRVDTEEQALSYLEEIRKLHRDATHNVYAYRIRENNIARFSDDGEPAKTAGAPIMDLILNENITNVIIIVTRYFGGTLLGTGGLVKAYQRSAKEAVNASGIGVETLCTEFVVTSDYTLWGKVEYELNSSGITILDSEYTDSVSIAALCPAEDFDAFQKRLCEVTNGKCEAVITGERWECI